jgi:7-cyano-7-deazaguanine reductase
MTKNIPAVKAAAAAAPKTRKTTALAPKADKVFARSPASSSVAAKPALKSRKTKAAAAVTATAPAAALPTAKSRQMPPNPPSRPSKELHVFPNPAPQRDYVIQFQVPEFTCHCPLTGQPDFAHFTIDMIADQQCVELKSLKMYFWSYRDEGAFHEKVTNTILEDIVKVSQPRFIRITAKWYVRGGIYTNVVVEHCKKGWKPQPRIDLPNHGFESGLLR